MHYSAQEKKLVTTINKKRHGANGAADSTMADINDVARIPYVIDNFDSVELAYDKKGKPSTSHEFRDKTDSPAPQVIFSKRVDGTMYIVEAIPDSSYKAVWVTSAYIAKKGPSHVSDAEAPHKTSDNAHAAEPFFVINIKQTTQNVKGDFGQGEAGKNNSTTKVYSKFNLI